MTERRINRIDGIEEGLSRLVGDLAAHQVGRVLRGAAGWGRRARHTAAENVAEYLQEESRDLVARAEMEAFADGVRETESAVDQLQKRVRILKGKA